MNMKAWIPLSLAIVLGLVAAKIARDVVAQRSGSQQSQTGDLKQVVVAKHTLKPGQELKEDDLAVGQFTPTNVTEGAFTTITELVGRVCQVDMAKGQPIVNAQLTDSGTGSGLAAVVPAGMRAITIEVNEFSSVGGMISRR